MSNTIPSSPISSAFNTPQAGDDLDASVLVTHYNTIRTYYNAHDADATVHVQSGAYASIPSASAVVNGKYVGTATVAGQTVAQLYYSTGSAWVTDTTFATSNGQPGIVDVGNSGSSKTIDWASGPIQRVTMTATCTFTFSNAITGGTYTLIMVQGGSGGYLPTLTGWDFGDNTPSYNTGVGKKNVVSGLYDGSEYLSAFAVKGA